MQKTALSLTNSVSNHLTEAEPHIGVSDLARLTEGWLLDCEIRQHSMQTLSFRRLLLEQLLWFLQQKHFEFCGKYEIRAFLAYITSGHTDKGGRWGNVQITTPVRPSTTKTYHSHLRTFFRWLIAKGALKTSPMDTIAAPISRSDQIQPFTEKQVQALLSASRRSLHPHRDETIVSFLLDTGLRASELCGLRISDLDLTGRIGTVMGKGNKRRVIYFGRTSAKALCNYLREEERENTASVFLSDRGARTGEPLTRSGLGRLVQRLGKTAKIETTRCSPHTFCHTFAVNFLRNGG